MSGLDIQPFINERLMITALVIIGIAFVIIAIVSGYVVFRRSHRRGP